MKLRSLRVQNFRCIEDSTEFTICPVTCLVGKNGAGKTSLLEALYKLNPDVQELADFDVLMEYPRARRRQYQKRAKTKPDDALTATWELDDRDVKKLEELLGAGAVKSRTVVVRKGYYPERRWAGTISDHGGPSVRTLSAPEPKAEARSVADVLASAGAIDLSAEKKAAEQRTAPPRPETPATMVDNSFFEKYVGKLLPKLLYFSEWHMMQGRISIDALLQRRQKGELTGPDRVFLALLELGGTSVDAISRIERSEELIADLEDAARPITEEIAKYWSQERDLRTSFHLYPGRPQDPSPFDRGLVFETRIVNTKTNLSLNFEERSTGFVWFFSFLVWYSDVRKRHGNDLLILLDDPGLGLHAKAQWDLHRYIREQLVPNHQVVYTTHSPFMVNPERMQWVRTVEEVSTPTPDGGVDFAGTKVGDEILSADQDTLLPLQASLGYRIMQDMARDRKKLLLVGKSADVIYLDWFSARLKQRGRGGLDPAWTMVPCGDLVRLATLVGLLANDTAGFAALLSLSPKDPDIVNRPELAQMLQKCHSFPLQRYAEPTDSTVEDLLGPITYLALVDLCYRTPRRQRLAKHLRPSVSSPILGTVSELLDDTGIIPGRFDPLLPAEYLLRSGDRKLHKLPGIDAALSRFEKLFADLNRCL